MALINIFRNGVKIVNKATKSLKANVTYRPWIGDDGRGRDEFGPAQTIRALVDPDQKQQFSQSGASVMTLATITILDLLPDTTPNAGKTRQNPIDPRDVFVLPGGGTAPIVSIKGFLDAGTERGMFAEVTLGTVIRGD